MLRALMEHLFDCFFTELILTASDLRAPDDPMLTKVRTLSSTFLECNLNLSFVAPRA